MNTDSLIADKIKEKYQQLQAEYYAPMYDVEYKLVTGFLEDLEQLREQKPDEQTYTAAQMLAAFRHGTEVEAGATNKTFDDFLKEQTKLKFLYEQSQPKREEQPEAKTDLNFTKWCGENTIGFQDGLWLYQDRTGRYNYTTEALLLIYKREESKPEELPQTKK